MQVVVVVVGRVGGGSATVVVVRCPGTVARRVSPVGEERGRGIIFIVR